MNGSHFCFLKMERGALHVAGPITPLFMLRFSLTWAIPAPKTERSNPSLVVIRVWYRADVFSTPKSAPPASISVMGTIIIRGTRPETWISFTLSSHFLPHSPLLSYWTALVPFLFAATAIVETDIISCLEMVLMSLLVSGSTLFPTWWLNSVPRIIYYIESDQVLPCSVFTTSQKALGYSAPED